jgi:3-methyl-2-oxobutanoate hydroxymethyltransferase
MARQGDAKISVRELQHLAASGGRRIVAVTAYDALFARLADESGADLILVGDSLGMTVLGYRNTIPVTLEQSLHHTAAVVRGTRRALVVGDMPFLTYQVSPEQALLNAGRYLKEAGADAVKIEGGARVAPTVERLVSAGIPVLGHVGLLPQAVLVQGGYRVHGRVPAEAETIERDAQAVQAAGAFALVLEGLPCQLSEKVTGALRIPTIGIGAGPGCSGQIQVMHDILGLFEEFVPRHTKRYAELARLVREALQAYRDEVQSGRFPGEENSFS